MNQQRRVECWWVWRWILLSHIVLVLFLSEGVLRKCWHLQTCKSAKPSFLYKPSYTDRLTFCIEKVKKKYCFTLKVKKMLSSDLGHWINWGLCLFPPLHTFCSTECPCTRLLRWELRGIYSWWDIHIQGCSMHTLHRKGAALMSWAGCSGLSTGLTFALFPTSCSDPALKTVSFISIWGFQWTHNSLTAETFTVTFLYSITPKWWGWLGSIPSDRKLLRPRKIKAKHNHVEHNFKFPKSDFWNSVLCSEHRSHWLQDAAVKVQHAYKSCTKNKTNVKLLTASEKIGSSDSAIIAWELYDRKRDSIQFSRVEHCSLAICSFPKFWLILYTA